MITQTIIALDKNETIEIIDLVDEVYTNEHSVDVGSCEKLISYINRLIKKSFQLGIEYERKERVSG